MKLGLQEAGVFKKCVDAISVLIDEAEFVVSPESFTLKATDPSQISLLDFALQKASFESFDVTEEKKLGLDVSYLGQIMSRSSPKDKLTLELDEKNARLKIVFQGRSRRTFSIPLLDISSAELPSPNLAFDAEVTLKAGVLQEAFKDAILISNHVQLSVDDERFTVKAHSSKGNVDHESLKDSPDVVEFMASKEANSMFPLEYLNDMLKAADSDTPVKLELKQDAPVRISYKIGEASITYLLAPRIES